MKTTDIQTDIKMEFASYVKYANMKTSGNKVLPIAMFASYVKYANMKTHHKLIHLK